MKAILVVFLCLFASVVSSGQEYPKGEIFGGFSYLRIDTQGLSDATLDAECNLLFGPGTCPPGTFGVHRNFYGWNGAGQFNANPWFGIKADLSGQYGTPVTLSSSALAYLQSIGISGLPPKANFFSYLFGPVVSQRFSRYTVFGHTLFGENRAGVNVHLRVSQIQIPSLTVSNTAFGMAFGGGVDARISPRFAVRGQADYLYTGHDFTSLLPNIAAHQNNLRASVGIVYRFGGQARVGPQGRERPRQERASVSSKPQSGIPITQLGLIALAREGGGAEITEISPGSIASLAGLRVGDIINAVDGNPVKTPIELESALANRAPGTKVKIGYRVRGYWQAQTEITLR